MQPTPAFFAWKIHGQRGWRAKVRAVLKSGHDLGLFAMLENLVLGVILP